MKASSTLVDTQLARIFFFFLRSPGASAQSCLSLLSGRDRGSQCAFLETARKVPLR